MSKIDREIHIDLSKNCIFKVENRATYNDFKVYQFKINLADNVLYKINDVITSYYLFHVSVTFGSYYNVILKEILMQFPHGKI